MDSIRGLLISKETKEALDKETTSNIQIFTAIIDNLRLISQQIDLMSSILESNSENTAKNNEFFHLKRLNEYNLLLGLIWLDIAAAIRVYLKADLYYEVIYATKQLIVTINEGYKKIYHFITIDKQGNKNLRNRNNSFWIKDIGKLISENMLHLQQGYYSISISLDRYLDENFDDFQIQRQLIVHYDDQPSKVYDMLVILDIEKVCQKVIPFMEILKKMFDFSNIVLAEYSKLIKHRKDTSFDDTLQKFEHLKEQYSENKQVKEFINYIQEQLIKFQNLQ